MSERSPSVAVVIPCYRHAHFLAGAIESALHQSVPPDEIIVVDDGSDDDPESVTARYPDVRLLSQPNRGLSAARNAGLHAAASDKIVFLDADDRLTPGAVRAGLDCFRKNPEAAFVYGAFAEVRGASESSAFCRVGSHTDMIRCNWIGCPAAVMYDRAKLIEQGGFDESLAMCEDWDAYLRLSRAHPFAAHGKLVARYVKHGANMSDDLTELKRWIGIVREREKARGLTPDQERAWREGEAVWRHTLDPNRKPPSPARRLVSKLLGPLRRALRA